MSAPTAGEAVSTAPVADATRPLAALLHSRLRGSYAPVIVLPDRTLPAASLWTSARGLVAQFRELGLLASDRVLVATDDDLALAAAIVAALSGGPAVAPLRLPATDHATAIAAAAQAVDASLILIGGGLDSPDLTGVVRFGIEGLDRAATPQLRATSRTSHEADVRILLSTSGTTGTPTWVALGEREIYSVLTSHLEVLFGDRWVPDGPTHRPASTMLSVLPWSHAFGLVLDLLVGLVAADTVVREPAAGSDPAHLSALLERLGVGAWLNCVPLTIDRLLAAEPAAGALLHSLAGGIIGGAPMPDEVSEAVAGTRIRVGYGMTEAGPGVTLGAPGDSRSGVVGRAVGCAVETAIDEDGLHRIVVRGANVSVGSLDHAGNLVRRDSRTFVTSDTGRIEGGVLTVSGRVGDRVKLANGRWTGLSELDDAVRRSTGRPAIVVIVDARPVVVLSVPVDADVAMPPMLAGAALHVVPASDWPRTAKGAVDRAALACRLGQAQGAVAEAPREPLVLPRDLDCAAVGEIPSGPIAAAVTEDSRSACAASRDGLGRILDAGIPVYGSTTGFGPHVRYAADDDPFEHGSGLIAHLASGTGPLLAPDLVRATMLVRANALSRGHSGVTPDTLDAFLKLLASDVVPAVPSIGSVGASGDLIPLAHIARVLTGEGWALAPEPNAHLLGRTVPAREALAAAGLTPRALDGRDALALVNGTAYSTAMAAVAVSRAELVVQRAAELAGWLYSSLGARRQAIDPRLHAARNQPGQMRAAAVIAAAAGTYEERTDRPLQEVYSVRCAAQVLGPAFDMVAHARTMMDDELGGVSDNPVIVADDAVAEGWVALHGGNFHAAPAATASDLVGGALAQAAVLAERQIDVLANPALSDAPLLLASRPGAQAGLAGAQLTASAVLAEIRHAAQWASTMSVPTNAGNQDVVPMAPLAARTALAQVDRTATVLAVLALFLRQYRHLVGRGLAAGYSAPPPAWLPDLDGHDRDVPTDRLIDDIRRAILAPGKWGTP